MRAVFDVPILSREVEREDQTGFDLRNNVRIEILSGDWRSVRGFTLLCAIVDEICFFGYDSDSKVRSDTELIRAIQPSLATSGGKLIGISSPYAEKGWSFNQFKRHWANDKSSTLVWKCPSRIMNSTLPQSIVDEALAEDLAAARAEYLAEFRQDVASYLPREVIEACVAKGRQQLSPQSGNRYSCFVDISGGRSDDAAMCIAHRDTQTQKIVVDFLRRWRPPFSPDQVISQMVELLAPYRIDRVNGDNYSAEFCKQSFETRGIRYNRSTGNVWNRNQSLQQTKSKSVLYLEMLPRLCSREVELLDDPTLINQLAGLERRTRSGGRDTVDHGPNGHDDCANAVAGAVDLAARSGRMLQVAGGSSHQGGSHLNNIARARAAWCSGIVPDSDRSPFHILGD